MRVCVTGICGHLGSTFARWLVANHPTVEVWGVDDLSCGYRENITEDLVPVPDAREGRPQWQRVSSALPIEIVEGDAADLDRYLYRRKTDIVYHFAAYAAECLSPFVRRYNYTNNVATTGAVVSACINRRVRRLVFASSIAVYGAQSPPFAESDTPAPIDPYGVAKWASEQDIAIAGDQHGLDWCTLRMHNVYGPGQSIWQKYRNVFGLWIRAGFEGQPLRVFGDGTQERAFTWAPDLMPCLWAAGTSELASRRTINLGCGFPQPLHGLAEMMRSMLDSPHFLKFEPARHEAHRTFTNTDQAVRLLGWREGMPLRFGLGQMVSWARMAWEAYPQRRVAREAFAIELQDGMPESWQRALAELTQGP